MSGGGLPFSFLKIEKGLLVWGKKGPDCVHLWVKFSIQDVVLVVCRRENSKMFPCGAFFLVLLTKYLSKCPSSIKTPCPEKLLVARLPSSIILFAKGSILNVWQCSEDASVLITAQ